LDRDTVKSLLIVFLAVLVVGLVLVLVYIKRQQASATTTTAPLPPSLPSPASDLPQMSAICDNSAVNHQRIPGVGMAIESAKTKVILSVKNSDSLTHLDSANLRLYDTNGDEVQCEENTSANTLDPHLLQPNETFHGTLGCTLTYDVTFGHPPHVKIAEVRAEMEEHNPITVRTECSGEPIAFNPEAPW
jgi:hypothetical protein